MHKNLLLSFLLLLALAGRAQTKSPADADNRIFNSYTVHIIPAKAGYGYEILQGGKLLLRQVRNPFNFASSGLLKKDDAFKAAQWQISQLQSGTPSAVLQRPIPKSVAQQLNIATN